MPRGGIHDGTLKPKWSAGKTTTIRVPIAKKNEILAIAKTLDQFECEAMIVEKDNYREAMDILRDAGKLPRNSGSKYWAEIRKALDLLGEDIDARYGGDHSD